MAYETKQGKALLDYLRTLGGRHVSVAEIAAGVEPHIGVTTIYRQLDRLEARGLVQKYITDGDAACYQYVGDGAGDCHGHFHLKCAACGQLIHLECEEFDKLTRHILTEHGFLTDPLRTSLYGTCRRCQEREKETGK